MSKTLFLYKTKLLLLRFLGIQWVSITHKDDPNPELTLKIGIFFFSLYKDSTPSVHRAPHSWRAINKREYGEALHPIQ